MLPRKRDCAARQPVPSPRGGGRRRRRLGGSSPPGAERGTDAARGGARASSYCRNRQNVLGLREARHRYRSGRKPARYTERVNGSLTTGRPPARKRRRLPGAKGGRFRGTRRSSSRERRVSWRVTWFRFHLGANGMRVAAADGRHPGSGMRTPFTRPPRNRSWRPPGHRVGFAPRKGAPTLTSPEEATGVSEANGIGPRPRGEDPLACERPGAEVGNAP